MTLRILHISTRLIVGGSQENTVLSCEGQARDGHEVHLAYGPIIGPEGSMLDRVEAFNQRARSASEGSFSRHDPNLDEGPIQPITTHEVPHLVREIAPLKDRHARRELRGLIERLRPDIVHTHSSKAGILARIAAWESSPRPAVVHTIHGPPFMPADGNPLNKIKVRALNHAYTLAERHAARRCHAIVSVADAMTEQFLARGIGRPGQYTTIRSGMDLAPYLDPPPDQSRADVRAQLGISASGFVIGTVARLAEHKGHHDILDALTDHLRAHADWKLLWVGDGWWASRLDDRVASLGLSSQVIRTGLVGPDRVPGLIRAMDILCHPSYREGLPRTVPQALLCGVCPVAYDTDGTGEACRDRQTGRLIRPGDITGLRDAIVELHADPALRQALADRGRVECTAVFDARLMVRRLEEVYARAKAMV